MSLLDGFYKIVNLEESESSVQALVAFDREHEIFKGHFPSQHVVPGVCMVQIVKEITEKALKKKLRLIESDNIKFLAVIDPNQHQQTNVAINIASANDHIQINASMHWGDTTFFKIKASLRPE